MGILKKSNAPSELPDLAIEGVHEEATTSPSLPAPESAPAEVPVEAPVPGPEVLPDPVSVQPAAPVQEEVPAAVATEVPIEQHVAPVEENIAESAPVAGEDYLEFPEHTMPAPVEEEEVAEAVSEGEEALKSSKAGFFDEVLNDINGEIKDLGNLEDWYEKKFMKQDVVSSMKGYWEGNKADILIESFGAEYKTQINEKVRALKKLEEDWRDIYFRLIKKEEEMKREERDLKETLSEFVNLCKGRKDNDKEEAGSEEE